MLRKKILVVDDESTITHLLKLGLEQSGPYYIREENQGPRALTTAREFKPDLIVLDLMIPDMDGGDIAAQLRVDPQLKRIPIVFLTGAVTNEELDRRGNVIGGFVYMAKPLNIKSVMATLEQHLAAPAPPA